VSAWLIAIVGAIYVGVAADQARSGQWGMSIMYFGYAFANVGAWMMVQPRA